MKFSMIDQYMYSAERLVSGVHIIRTLTARYGSHSRITRGNPEVTV